MSSLADPRTAEQVDIGRVWWSEWSGRLQFGRPREFEGRLVIDEGRLLLLDDSGDAVGGVGRDQVRRLALPYLSATAVTLLCDKRPNINVRLTPFTAWKFAVPYGAVVMILAIAADALAFPVFESGWGRDSLRIGIVSLAAALMTSAVWQIPGLGLRRRVRDWVKQAAPPQPD